MDEPRTAVPPVTDTLREQAAQQPGSWIFAIDPHFDPDGKVPPYGVVGAWKVDDRGHLSGEFQHNPKYRPSPRARGMKDPTDPVDAVIQLAATGYASDTDVQSAILDSTVYVVPGSTSTTATRPQTNQPFILAIYTSPLHAPSSVPEVQRTHFRDLLATLPELGSLKLNPHGSVSVEIPLADIRRAASQ